MKNLEIESEEEKLIRELFPFGKSREELLSIYPDFGKTVKAYRLNNRVTMFEMSRAIGVSSAQLSGMEVGRTRAPMHIVYRLAKYMELSKKQRKQFRKDAEWVNKNYRQIREKRDEELKHAWRCDCQHIDETIR